MHPAKLLSFSTSTKQDRVTSHSIMIIDHAGSRRAPFTTADLVAHNYLTTPE
jgi:hypothetical protein